MSLEKKLFSGNTTKNGSKKHGDKDASGFFSAVQSAVTGALQSAKASGTAEDPNEVVEQAIEGVLASAKNGTDFSSTNSTSQSGNPLAGNPTAGAGMPDANGTPAQATFYQTLKADGIDPQQYNQDFLNAMRDVMSGGSNPTTSPAISTGSAFDAFA
jgi:hypothetical protein